MSYILDALKRAERERKQGQVSVLDEIPATPSAQAPVRRLPRWLLPAAALAVALALAYLLFGWRHHTVAPGAPAATASAPPQTIPQPQPPPAAIAPQAPPPQYQAPAAQLTDNGKMSTLADLSDEPAPVPRAAPEAPRAPAPAASQDQAAVAETSAGDDAAPAPEAAAAEAAMTPPPQQQAAPVPAGAQQLIEMPDTYRAQFPQFSLDVLAYNNDPKRRFALIGGHQYHEGDTLAEGPVIVEIKPNGIVFDWQGQRVLYASAR